MSRRTGLISHQDDNGLLYVFVPGRHRDLVIDERKTPNDEQCFHIGDFISFVDINGSITSPTRTNKLLETFLLNNRLQVKVSVAFPPEKLSIRAQFTTFTTYPHKILAWSPDFAFICCSPDVAKEVCRNKMYKAWIERVPRMTESIAGISVSWQIVDGVLDECDEQSKRLISKAPWNRKKNSQLFRTIPCSDHPHKMQETQLRNPRHFVASLKKYIDNYEGLVTAVHDSSAVVWSLAIPDSEVNFRANLEYSWVPDYSNHRPSVRPYLGCYLHGKKFEIIDPVLSAQAFNNTVQVEITTTVAVNNLKYYPTGEVTLETEILGDVEFGQGKFRQNYCNRRLSLLTCKNIPSKRTGAVWQVFSVLNEGCAEFTQQSNSVINFSNMNDNPYKEFVSTKKNECNAKVEINDDCHFTEIKLHQPDLSSDLPGTAQKVVDDSFYSDFCNDNVFDNCDVDNVQTEEEYDPLKEPAFGAVQPHVLQINSSVCSSGIDRPDTLGNWNTGLNEEISEDEQEKLDNRATEYWIRAWQIPGVRQQIKEADMILHANVMQLMTDLGARTGEDNLEKVLKPLSNDGR
ncbi:hypothetical protein LOAG_18833 [Loa loa]|uniref:p-granule-associated protein DEPS-1 second OB-fold domain-containing protein n=1 Tax=Loa loa TaxID=7209 RepID=A0A1S0UFZ2_LOALO|nr:hypothetical protein LOAG_18833 [Loa loa]EJD73764.1 hypothetical protein LOAG_18833 [Loa loa]